MALLSSDSSAIVPDSTRSVTYDPSTATATFTVPFTFHSRDWLLVTLINESTSGETTLVNGVNYRVRLPSTTANGSVVMVSPSTVGTGYQLRIERVVPITQTTSFIEQGDYSAHSHEVAVDKLTMIAQQIIAQAGTDAATAVGVHEGKADPHPQYVLSDGRAGGQTVTGGTDSGENLVFRSNADVDGLIILSSGGTGVYVADTDGWLGIGTSSPVRPLDVVGSASFGSGGQVLLGSDSSPIVGTENDTDKLYVQTGIDADESEGVGIVMDGTADTIKLHTVAGEVIIGATDNPVDPWVTFSSTLVESEAPIQAPALIGGDGSGDSVTITSTSHATKGLATLGSGNNYIQLDEANGRAAITESGTGPSEAGVLWHVRGVNKAEAFVSTSCTETCADSGDGSAAACSTTNTLNNCTLFLVTCNDSDGCTLTFTQTSGIAGTAFTAVNVSTSTVTLADTSDQKTAATALGQYDTATFVYVNGDVYQTGGSNN